MTPTPATAPSGPPTSFGVTGLRSGGTLATETIAQATSTQTTIASSSRACRTIRSDAGSPYSTAEAAAKAPATTRPIGVARTKPAFFPARMTPGVASACSPRKPALTANASPIRSSRPSRRRRALSVIAKASTMQTTAVASTSQKCAGVFSQRSSIAGAPRRSPTSPSGRG